tara:strand:- start:2611 stop:3168 length:558 start_codon:yes stop_codon:yes gene_type:complete
MIVVDYLTYTKNGVLPDYLQKSINRTKSLGYDILPITPDEYHLDNMIGHCSFIHLRDITLPKIEKIRDKLTGFFVCEGDIWIKDDFTFDEFKKKIPYKPMWYGYKGQRRPTFIQGAFLLYIPMECFDEFKYKINKCRKMFIDRFYTRLYLEGFIEKYHSTMANEITHYSNVVKKIRQGIDLEVTD